jgi:hypothetical protein
MGYKVHTIGGICKLVKNWQRNYSFPLMPSTQVPEKDLKHPPDNPDDK